MPAQFQTPDICPVCGADIPPRARACPECGADETTGWNEDATRYDGLDLPGESSGESFDTDETLQDENLKPRLRPQGLAWHWWLVGIVLVVVLIYAVLRGRW
jgi:predicted nucleic acid-binding Zn ribbon protein